MYVSSTHKFKENVPVVYAFHKKLKSFKEFFELNFFALSINIKNRRNFVNRINENFK